MKLVGIVLVVLGLAGLLYGGISWSHQDTVIDAGPIEISRTERERVPVPPLVGGLLLIAGVVLLVKRS